MMKQRQRIYYSDSDRDFMWDRWQKGDSMRVIAGLFGRGHSSVQRIFSDAGGIRPRQRCRSRLALKFSEREEISRGIVAGHSIRSIAASLGRAPSTVSRELKRNGGRRDYRAGKAERAAWTRAHRHKICKLVQNRPLARIVAKKLIQRWSPEQIAGWLKKTYPEDENYQVSHEIIYRSLYVQARGALKKELIKHLRTRRSMRHSRHGTRSGEGQGQIKDMISISERPASVEDRAVPGHWEGDLIVGSNDSYMATLVERHTRYVMLAKVTSKDTKTVINALIKQSKNLPRELYRSLTWDRGKELSDHKRFSLATDIDVYFCDPQSPWQRGSNENTNGLLRQYFPKGTDLSVHSQKHLNNVACELNDRPRKTLGFCSPAEKFNECVALIH